MHLLHVSKNALDYSRRLNVTLNTLHNGSGCINTISCEGVGPPSTVNVLIVQRWAVIKLFHEFQ